MNQTRSTNNKANRMKITKRPNVRNNTPIEDMTYSHNATAKSLPDAMIDGRRPFTGIFMGPPKASSMKTASQLKACGMCGIYYTSDADTLIVNTV